MNKVNIQGLDMKLTKIYGDECEKNVVGIVIFNNDGKFFFDPEFKNQVSDEEVEALLLRGAVVDRGGKYYRPSSFNSEKVSFSDAVVNPEDIEVDLSGYVTKDELEEAIGNIDIPNGGGVVNNYWAGKKMVVNGDSIAYGSALASPSDAFPYKVAEQLGMEIVNYAISGTTIAKPVGAYEKCFVSKAEWDKAVTNGEVDMAKKYLVNTETGAPRLYKIYRYSDGTWTAENNESARTPLSDRIGAMDKDADVIMIFCGSNDFYYNWTPFGDFEASKYRALESTPTSVSDDVNFDMENNLVKSDGVTFHENSVTGTGSGTSQIQPNSSYFTYNNIPVIGGCKLYAPYGRGVWFKDADGNDISYTNFTNSGVNYTIYVPKNVAYITVVAKYEEISPEDFGVYMSIDSTSGDNTGGDNTGGTSIVDKNETYCDALHMLCRYLLKTYNNKDIIFCTPIKRVQHKGESNGTWDCVYPEDKNSYGKTLADYRDTMIEACEYYSIPCIDLYTLSGLNPHINPNMFADTDGKHTHPSVEGHERLASVIVAQMKALRS